MRVNLPVGWYLYAVHIAVSSLLIPFGFHRALYSLLHALSVPELVISALSGVVNLCWYELAYVLGGALKNVYVFLLIPMIGSATGFLSAILLVTRFPLRAQLLRAHLVFSGILGILSLGVLLLRSLHGYGDSWRLVTTTAFLVMYAAWLFYFQRTGRLLRST